MKTHSIEILLIVAALIAALVTIAAVDIKGDLAASNSVTAKPGIYPPPAIVAPEQFPWFKMPQLPEQSYQIRVPPFLIPAPYPGPESP